MDRHTYPKSLPDAYTGVCVGANTIKSITNDVIDFYLKFDRYNHLTYVDLWQHIHPSIKNNQYKVFQTNGEIWGFANWAFMNNDVLHKFTTTGKIHTLDWMTGFNLCYIDFVASRDAFYVMKWLKNHSVRMMGANRPIYWARSTKHKIKRVTKQHTKGHWLWAE
jgi:hemolysin-activating ACP:hemolysin acyltransferase